MRPGRVPDGVHARSVGGGATRRPRTDIVALVEAHRMAMTAIGAGSPVVVGVQIVIVQMIRGQGMAGLAGTVHPGILVVVGIGEGMGPVRQEVHCKGVIRSP